MRDQPNYKKLLLNYFIELIEKNPNVIDYELDTELHRVKTADEFADAISQLESEKE